MNNMETKNAILSHVKACDPRWMYTSGENGAILGIMARSLAQLGELDPDAARRRLLYHLFSDVLGRGKNQKFLSSKSLTSECWYALLQWVKPEKCEDGGGWLSANPEFHSEIAALLAACQEEDENRQAVFEEMLAGLGYSE